MVFAVGLIVLGRFFKIQHYPNSNEFTIVGLIMACSIIGYQLLSKKDRKVHHYLGGLIVLLLLISTVMRLIRASYLKEITIALFALGIVYVIAYLYEMNKTQNISRVIKSNLILILGSLSILLGALFKIQHWPGASPLLLIGLLTVGYSLVSDKLK